MARLALTVEQEMIDFERMLASYMPWGATVFMVDEHFEVHPRPGSVSLMCSTATVLHVGLGEEGAYYSVAFGPPDVYGPASDDDTDPATSAWTLNVTDPIVELSPDGSFALEVLDATGAHHAPEQWLRGAPFNHPEHLLVVDKGYI